MTLRQHSSNAGTASAAPLRVLFLPDFADANPYQRELRTALEIRGVSVSGARAPGRDPVAVLRAWLTHGRPPVVHLHWTHNYLGQRADGTTARFGRVRAALFLGQLRILRSCGIRIVWTVHNLGHHDQAGDAALNARVHRRLVGLSDAVICHCQVAVESVVATYGIRARDRDKFHVIPHGNYVDVYGPQVERETARRHLSLPEDSRILLFVGAIRAYKGLTDLTDAFRHIPQTDVRLLIAGKPATDADVQPLTAAAAADPRIELRLGFVPDGDLPVLLGAADAVVLPFRDILTSGSAILAMSYSRPVVAPSLGCLPDTLDPEASILYDPANPDALAKALGSAIGADLDAMGARAQVLAARLAWGPIAVATAELYRA